jgi:hypothetical protein
MPSASPKAPCPTGNVQPVFVVYYYESIFERSTFERPERP